MLFFCQNGCFYKKKGRDIFLILRYRFSVFRRNKHICILSLEISFPYISFSFTSHHWGHHPQVNSICKIEEIFHLRLALRVLWHPFEWSQSICLVLFLRDHKKEPLSRPILSHWFIFVHTKKGKGSWLWTPIMRRVRFRTDMRVQSTSNTRRGGMQ